MTIDPLLSGLMPPSPLHSSAAAEVGDAAAFDEALQAVMAGVEQATAGTVDLMWDLQQRLLVPTDGWYQGQTIANLPAALASRNALLGDFAQAIGAVLRDYGISTDTEIRFTVDALGQVTLAAPHPDAAKIEALIQGSPVLRTAITAILADTHRIAMASLAKQGKATPELADDMRENLTLVLLQPDNRMVGEVRYNGSVLASSEFDGDWASMLSALEMAIGEFDRAERERQKAYQHAMQQLKLEDERRRVELKTAKDKDLADRLSDREAAERRVALHPEQGHTPVFI